MAFRRQFEGIASSSVARLAAHVLVGWCTTAVCVLEERNAQFCTVNGYPNQFTCTILKPACGSFVGFRSIYSFPADRDHPPTQQRGGAESSSYTSLL